MVQLIALCGGSMIIFGFVNRSILAVADGLLMATLAISINLRD